MAALKTKRVNPEKITHQQVSMPGHVRNILVAVADKNRRSLSAEITFRIENDLRREGLLNE